MGVAPLKAPTRVKAGVTAHADRFGLDSEISGRRRGAGEREGAYIDGELCGVDAAGLPSFARTQAATDGERGVHLVYYAFDLLHVGGWDISNLELLKRKELLEPLVANKPGLQFNGHDTGDGELILKHAGKLGFEGVVSKTIDAPYAPGNRGLWRKAKALNRQEFVVVGWSDPEGSRPHLGALLLGYYTDDGKLIYAGRVGTGMPVKVLADLPRRLDPLARKTSPLNAPPPRSTRFGSQHVLSRRPLGRAAASCGDHLSDLDGRQPLAAYRLRRPARRQAGGASTARELAMTAALTRLTCVPGRPLRLERRGCGCHEDPRSL